MAAVLEKIKTRWLYRRTSDFPHTNFRAADRTLSGGVGDGIERTMLWTSFERRAVVRPTLEAQYCLPDN